MALVLELRNKARATVDGFFCSSSPDIRPVGDIDSGGWYINVSEPLRVIYCAGVGLDMSFEVALAKMAAEPVLVFDPSPTGIATVEKSDITNIKFFPVGLAVHSGSIEFSLPKDAAEGSYSVVQDGVETIQFDCYDLGTIMSTNGDSYIDLLKMDIEGFEFDIVNQLLDQCIPVRQLCVEFHSWLRPGQTLKTIARLHRAGYRLIHKKRGDYTFLLDESRYAELQRSHSQQPA
ncbi:FkbM family methyltransferase [Tunturibacter empetritectus]|uniref:FkbM family methyltransferase n=1 Tax=Tunturiibacter lichenicola TaxID=2051959 RepID=A0A7W8JCT6_9BACT|nr:FkbM family methyltransferase [Edaphobacter lichenicola]MBB5345666.1 FkbM family methyltransferase [Edaphobacter lichenicola]